MDIPTCSKKTGKLDQVQYIHYGYTNLLENGQIRAGIVYQLWIYQLARKKRANQTRYSIYTMQVYTNLLGKNGQIRTGIVHTLCSYIPTCQEKTGKLVQVYYLHCVGIQYIPICLKKTGKLEQVYYVYTMQVHTNLLGKNGQIRAGIVYYTMQVYTNLLRKNGQIRAGIVYTLCKYIPTCSGKTGKFEHYLFTKYTLYTLYSIVILMA